MAERTVIVSTSPQSGLLTLSGLALASEAETLAGVDLDTKAVTPAGLFAVVPWINPLGLGMDTGATGTENRTALAAATARATSSDVRQIRIPGGLYLLDKTPITVTTAGRFDLRGDGTVVLQRADGAHDADFQYMFALAATSGAKRYVIADLTLDGNRRGNVPASPTDWEHSALINIASGSGTEDIDSVVLSNIEIRDAVADGIWVSRYYVDSLIIDKVIARDRAGTRSDIGFSAFPQYTMISNCDVDRLEGEALSIPVGVTNEFHIHVVNSTIRTLFDCAGAASASVTQRVWWHVDGCYIDDLSIVRTGGRFSNCQIHYQAPSYNDRRIQYADTLTMENCDFYLHADGAGVIAPILVSSEATNRATKLSFKNCRFHVVPDTGYVGAFTGTAIEFDPWNTAGTVPEYEVSDCWFDARFEESIFADRPGRVTLTDNDYGGTARAVRFAQSASIPSTFIFDGGKFDRVTGNMFRVSCAAAGNVYIRNLAIPEARAVFTVASGTLTTLPVSTERIIYVTAAPTGGAFRGDRARLVSPAAGAAIEWVATAAHVTAATWVAAITLP